MAIGRLAIGIDGDNTGLTKSTKEVQREIRNTRIRANRDLARMREGWRRLRTTVVGFANSLLNVRTILGTLIGGGVLGVFTREASRNAAELQTIANSAGVAASSLGALRSAYEGAGIAITGADAAFADFNEKLGDYLVGGGGTLSQVLKDLEATSLAGVLKGSGSIEEKFDAILQHARGIANESERAFFLTESLGGSTNENLALFEQLGGKTLREYRDQLIASGEILDDVATSKLAAINRSFVSLGNYLKTQFSLFLIENVDLIDELAETVRSVAEVGLPILGNALRSVLGDLRNFRSFFGDFQKTLDLFTASFTLFANNLGLIFGGAFFIKAISTLSTAVLGLIGTFAIAGSVFRLTESGIKNLGGVFGRFALGPLAFSSLQASSLLATMRSIALTFGSFGAAIAPISAALAGVLVIATGIYQAFKSALETARLLGTSINDLTAADLQARISQLEIDIALNIDQGFYDAADRLEQEAQSLRDALDRLNNAQNAGGLVGRASIGERESRGDGGLANYLSAEERRELAERSRQRADLRSYQQDIARQVLESIPPDTRDRQGVVNTTGFAGFAERRKLEREAEEARVKALREGIERRRELSAKYYQSQVDDINTFADTATAGFRSLTDAILEFVKEGTFSFRNFLNNILTQIARATIDRQVTQPLTESVAGLIGGLFAPTATPSNDLLRLNAQAIRGVATGGLIRGEGTGTSDSILARLSNGEFVVNARATRQHLGTLMNINGGGNLPAFQNGGLVGNARFDGNGGGTQVIVQNFSGENVREEKRTENGRDIITVAIGQATSRIAKQISTGTGEAGRAVNRRLGTG